MADVQPAVLPVLASLRPDRVTGGQEDNRFGYAILLPDDGSVVSLDRFANGV